MALIQRYVNTASTAGGDGTTNATSGANRAYASLSEWEAAEQTDLVLAGDTHRVDCSGTADDTTAVTIAGWTTGVSNYIEIYGDVSAAAWNTSKYTLSGATNLTVLTATNNYVRVYGIQVILNVTSTYRYGINFTGAANDGEGYIIDGCISKLEGTAQTGSVGFRVKGGSTDACVLSNCIAIDFNGVSNTGFDGASVVADKVVMYNCLAYNATLGFTTGYLDTIAKNCIAQACTDGFSNSADWSTSSTNNLSDLASDAPGTSPIQSTLTFVDAANDDYSLASGDTGAIDAGVDLSSDSIYAFSVDIAGTSRPASSWDVGPHEYVSGATVYTRTLSSSVDANDQTSRGLEAFRLALQSQLDLASSINQRAQFFRLLSSNFNLTDDVVFSVFSVVIRTVSSSLSIDDSVSISSIFNRDMSSGVDVSEALSSEAVYYRSMLSTAELVTGIVVSVVDNTPQLYARVLSDSIGTNDALIQRVVSSVIGHLLISITNVKMDVSIRKVR